MTARGTALSFWRRLRDACGPVATAALSTMSLRIANVIIGVATTILLGRVLGADGFGVFAIGLASAALFSGPAKLALNHHVVGKAVQYAATQDWALLNGIRLYVIIIVSISTALLGLLAAALLTVVVSEPIGHAAALGLAIAPLIIADSIASALLRGLGKVGKAYYPQFLVTQSAHLAFTIAMANSGKLTPQTALISFAAAWLIAAALSWLFVARSWPAPAKTVRPIILPTEWSGGAIFILIGGISGVLFGRIETFALANFSTAAAVGVYALAFRFAQFVTFPTFALASGITVEVSRLIAHDKPGRAQQKARAASRIATGMTLVASVILFLLCSTLFPLINPEFEGAALILLILSLGYTVQAASGFPMPLIVAFKLEQKSALPGFLIAIVGSSLVFLFTAAWGAVGAAMATTAAVVATAITRCIIVYRNVNLRSDIFSDGAHNHQVS